MITKFIAEKFKSNLSRLRPAIGLRSKITLIACMLLTLPWIGYNYILEMEKLLRQGQEQTLIGTSRAVATALNERPNLFSDQASFLQSVQKGRDLYAYELSSPIKLDGQTNDWADYTEQMVHYGRDYVQFSRWPYQHNGIQFNHMVGKYDGYLYAIFEVNDDKPVMRRKGSSRVDRNDHLIIALTAPNGEFHRYVVSVYEDGWFNAWQINGDIADPADLVLESQIQGYWRTTDNGYNIELRLPLSMLGSKLGFAFYDVNNTGNREIETIIGTSNTNQIIKLGTVLIPSPEIENILKGMGHTSTRIWVIDRHQRVLAQSGDIQESNGVWSSSVKYGNKNSSWWTVLEEKWLHPLYYRYLINEPTEFSDSLKDAAKVEGVHISQALQGRGYSHWRQSSDGKAMILAAAYPIWLGDNVMGAVVAEESTIGIQTLRNRALEELLNALFAIILVGTLTLFLFASNISRRIRKLRNEAEHAIDTQGKIQHTIAASTNSDEIGDLSRSLAGMVSRLGQYNHYLENLSSRLSHELRTPVAVVRSSIENLSMQEQDEDSKRYIERAQEGVQRLNTILSSMTEATRIEQSLQGAEKELFPLNELVEGCMQGYQMAYANQIFRVDRCSEPVMINGAPDYLAQLLDKLISNAVDFSRDDHPIEVTLSQIDSQAFLTVSNHGPLLPENMNDQLLNSMVSVRTQSQQNKPHLGLGLFIARLITDYHQGKILLRNRTDKQGVEVCVTLPVATLEGISKN
ncbi:proteobacterial dedicated sortase system histidine kinase [Photobacterium gaetbulicola]|uniref:histidine kinase n=1 Tax=Photobacterium gaetbulicola Gung47 TaxID=658445 RepID=A0A0C5WF74_9GAMM|nr:proteobacterial dedicated sortase system histidine kinase [Photobacterium gaetbulicola]AJR05753.1 sensor histidine kinase [Photobacterium gaetbulicola Gung47]PSU14719.1 proteobacterial dedicated sortase system histidine kinase [Photobacterium gaetbulicola]